MKSKYMRNFAEIVGVLAIVASLVFVGLEQQQSQAIAIAAQYQERTDSGRQYFYEALDSAYRMEELAEDIGPREWPAEFLTDKEKQWLEDHAPLAWAEAHIWANIDLYGFDNYYYQYQSGFLSEEGWRAMETRLSDLLQWNLFARYQIVFQGEFYRESFVQLAQKMVADRDAE